MPSSDSGPQPPTGIQRWLLTSPIGQALWAVPLALLLMLPARWLGLSWPIAIVLVGVGFVAGWFAARGYWRRSGYVPKI